MNYNIYSLVINAKKTKLAYISKRQPPESRNNGMYRYIVVLVFEIGSEIMNGRVRVIEERYLESIMLSVLVIFNESKSYENQEIKSLIQLEI